MPYVVCPSCGVRDFVLAPWSKVVSCPSCEQPVRLPGGQAVNQLPRSMRSAQCDSTDAPAVSENGLPDAG